MTKNMSTQAVAKRGTQAVQPSSTRVGELDAMMSAARERLSEWKTETLPRKPPEAILELSLGNRPAARFIGSRDARPASLQAFHRKIRRTRDLLIEAGMPSHFTSTPVESFPWHCVDKAVARSFARLVDKRYPNVKSRHNLLGILREILRECAAVDLISITERDRLLECLPLRGQYTRGAGRELTDEEIAKLLGTGLNQSPRTDLRNRAILVIFLSTGLRVSEVAEIEVGDLDLDSDVRTVTVKRTKNGSKRVVWLTLSALDLVNEWLEVRGNYPGALFDTRMRPGIPLDADSIAMMITQRARKAGITCRLTSHDFRRTVATRALRQNVDPFTVQRLLGHKNVQTTLCYDRRTEMEDRAVVDTLDLPGISPRDKGRVR